MSTFALSFLGTFDVTRDGVPLTRFRSDKVRALLAFLATAADRPHTRAALAALLWPDQGDEAASRNLSQTLLRLRAALGDSAAESPLLFITRATIQWRREAAGLDVAQFARLARSADPDDLALATALYRGEFLQGFGLADCEPFEEWLLLTREQLHVQALATLHTLTSHYLAQGRWTEAMDGAHRQIELDPWREVAHRQLMQALAESGDRAGALAQFARCRKVLADELGVEPDAESHTLYERLLAGDLTPATRDPAARRHNLPAALTPFVGREAELRALAAFRQQADVRLVSLVGPGGMGKTRLALEAARAGLDTYADGVFFVALAPLVAAEAIGSAIAQALGVTLHGSNPTAALLRWVRDKHLLLILDNFEHLLAGVGLLMELLEVAPRVQVIATSRERLNVRGEHVYGVEGLEYGRGAQPASAAAAAGLRLFVQGARRAQPDFRLHEAELPALRRICELVGGMPLGLELAAAWVGLLPLEAIAREITRDMDFLEARWPDAPARQRSMRAVFDWSWRLLSDAEQQALRRLSVFHGGFTREAAETIAGATLRVLAGLQRKSLLHWRPADGTDGRYEIHDLLRQFAAEQLPAGDERATVEARHGSYYLSFVAERERRLTRNEPSAAAAEIRDELDNVRQAWGWAVRHARLDELERTAYSLGQFYILSGLLAEGEQALASAAACVGDIVARAAHDAPARRQSQRVLSRLWSFQAMGLNLQSAYDQALPLARRAVELGQASGGVVGEAMGALVWGEVLGRTGQQRDARPLFERALRLVRTATQRGADAGVLSETAWRTEIWQAILALLVDDFAEARERVAQALRICQAETALAGEMTCLHRLATTAIRAGDYLAARDAAEQALQRARALSYPWGEGVAQLRLGQALHILGGYARAPGLIEGALAIFHEIGDRTYEAETLAYDGRLADSWGDYARARDRLDQALGLSRAVQAYEPMLDALVGLSLVSQHMGNHERALTYAEQAWEIAHAMGSRLRQAHVLGARGHALAGLRRPAEAVTAYQHALTLYAEIGVMAPLTSAAWAGLARIALGQGDLEQALAHVNAVLPVLAGQEPVGLEEPFEVYLTCYHVLAANHDQRAAEVLGRAQRQLHAYADDIADAALRQSFLEHVAIPDERAGPSSGFPPSSAANAA